MVVTYSDRDLAASMEAGSRGLDTECTVRHMGKGKGKLIGHRVPSCVTLRNRAPNDPCAGHGFPHRNAP